MLSGALGTGVQLGVFMLGSAMITRLFATTDQTPGRIRQVRATIIAWRHQVRPSWSPQRDTTLARALSHDANGQTSANGAGLTDSGLTGSLPDRVGVGRVLS